MEFIDYSEGITDSPAGMPILLYPTGLI